MSAVCSPRVADCSLNIEYVRFAIKFATNLLQLFGSEQLRFSQLSKNIPGITNTVLSGCLRDMERDGILLRHQFNEIPPHVEYSLTEKGRTLSSVLLAIADWGMEN